MVQQQTSTYLLSDFAFLVIFCFMILPPTNAKALSLITHNKAHNSFYCLHCSNAQGFQLVIRCKHQIKRQHVNVFDAPEALYLQTVYLQTVNSLYIKK